MSDAEKAIRDLALAYVSAWESGDPSSLAAVYTDDVTIRRDYPERSWNGLAEVAGAAVDEPPLSLGPWPAVFVYESEYVEAIVLFQLGGDCPMLEARRWVLAGSKIDSEMRFTHVPSARRCHGQNPID